MPQNLAEVPRLALARLAPLANPLLEGGAVLPGPGGRQAGEYATGRSHSDADRRAGLGLAE